MTDKNDKIPEGTKPDPPQVKPQEQKTSGSPPEKLIERLRKKKPSQIPKEEKENLEKLKKKAEQVEKTKEETESLTLRKSKYDWARDVMSRPLIKYAIQAFGSLILFSLFFITAIGTDWLSGIYQEVSIMIMLRIVSWIISVLGGICCIALVVKNTISFIKFLIKGPPQESSSPSQRASNEEGGE